MGTVAQRLPLAINGGRPVREKMLPYGRQQIEEADIQAVVAALRSDWLTTGPRVARFEDDVASYAGAKHAIAFSSGTAALHAAAHAAGLKPGDEAITTPLTFCATANCVVYEGATPVFADIQPGTLNLDPEAAAAKINARTRAILPVDYAGQPADLEAITGLAEKHGLVVIEDACHALGAEYKGRRVGHTSHMTVFSFHPVKHITTAEGGMVTTDDAGFAKRLRIFRNHGITTTSHQREMQGSWFYEMAELGFNYRLSDMQCALGSTQLSRVDGFLKRRREIAAKYDAAFSELSGVKVPSTAPETRHAYHLYVVRLDLKKLKATRQEVFAALRAEGIGVNVHYIPVHLHPYYRERFGTRPGTFPHAEAAYQELLSLPMFPAMSDQDCDDVMAAMTKVIGHYSA